MANQMRWRYGDTKPVMLPVDASTVIETGDLVFLDTDDVKPASSLSDQGTLSLNQEGLHDNFVGVAMQASSDGETALIRVATSGIFEFNCDAATFEVGDLIGGVETAAGNSLENQKSVAVASANLAIGRCVKRANPAAASVYVDIVSTVVHGGVQVAA